MRVRLQILFFNLIISASVLAQCPTGNVTLSSQQAVNDFGQMYPKCSEIAGNLIIYGSDIFDLTPLDNITQLNGYLEINSNDALTTLNGLSNLAIIGGNLRILANNQLTSLQGLENLTQINGYLSINSNVALSSLHGLHNIQPGSIGSINVTGNSILATCSLENICTFLVDSGSSTIQNNATGCESVTAVQNNCNGLNQTGPGTGFITTWKTDNPGISNFNQVTIPIIGGGYNYNIYWEEVGNASVNGSVTGITGEHTITFPAAGTYQVEITGDFPRIYTGYANCDKDKLLSIEQWGDIEWHSMNRAFSGAHNLKYNATDIPDLSNVTDMNYMFLETHLFNGDLSNWNVSTVTSMKGLFASTSLFNGDISNWDVSNVEDMSSMFYFASSFNQNIGTWDISNVTKMSSMLHNTGLSTANYDNTLIGWAAQTVQPNVALGAQNLKYCAAVDERQSLVDDHGWSISGDAIENANCTAMMVYITTEQGDTLTIQAESSDAIQQLKMRIQDEIGVPPSQQRLIFNNQILELGRTLVEYSIADEDILHLVVMSIPVMACPDKLIESCDAIVTFDLPEASSTWGSLSVVQTDNTGLASGSVFPTGITTLTYRASNAAGTATCSIEVEVLPDLSIAHTSGVQHGDTLHLAQCLPPAISKEDLELGPHQNRSSLRSTIYSQPLPPKDERPAGLWKVLLYAYEVSDQCGHREIFEYYVALYDLEPPVFRNFPQDTMVNGPEDLPSVAEDVRIIDICRYVVWDTVTTAPVLNHSTGDTLAFVRRWMAEDEVGNKSFRDQMIYLRPEPRIDLNSITAQIVKEKDLVDGWFLETTGTLGVPVSLYHIDGSGTSVAIDTRSSGKWQGQYGSVFFTPILSGSYRIKVDLPDGYAAVHPDSLVHADGWSDTLTLTGDSTLDIGTILLVRDTISEDQPIILEQSASDQSITVRGLDFKVYPNPSAGWIKVMLPETGTYDFTIFNRLGQSVKTGTVEHGTEIDLMSQKDGMYFIRLEKDHVYLETRAVLLFAE